MIPGAFAHRPHACRAIQFQMNQPPLARRHRIESKRLAPSRARAAPPPAPTILIPRAASCDNPRNRTARDRAAADRAAASDARYARAPAAAPHCASSSRCLIRAAKRHHHVPSAPQRRPSLRARAARRNLILESPVPSRARTHPDNASTLPPRAHGRNALPRAAYLFHRRPSCRPDAPSPFVHSFFFLNLLLDGSGSVRFR